MVRERVANQLPAAAKLEPAFQDFRAGDIKDSQADITRAQTKLSYAPTHTVGQGLDETVAYALTTPV
jgi:UDP-N-acetylglucosamine 4-epimerase